jgi:hypothetical protein
MRGRIGSFRRQPGVVDNPGVADRPGVAAVAWIQQWRGPDGARTQRIAIGRVLAPPASGE